MAIIGGSPNIQNSLSTRSAGFSRAAGGSFSQVFAETADLLRRFGDPSTEEIEIAGTVYSDKKSLAAQTALSIEFDTKSTVSQFILKAMDFQTRLYQSLNSLGSK